MRGPEDPSGVQLVVAGLEGVSSWLQATGTRVRWRPVNSGTPNRRQTTSTKLRILGTRLQGVDCKPKPEQLQAHPAVPVGRLIDPSNLRLEPTTQVSAMQILLRALELLPEPIYTPTFHLWYVPSKPTC